MNDEIEIMPEMIEAGVETANLISYQWGFDDSRILVKRVYQAMVTHSLKQEAIPHPLTPNKDAPQ